MNKQITNIVFTKNRPLQLDAYLESLYRHFPSELVKTYVLYKVELFEEEYEQLFRKYSDCVVIKESDFHSDFLKILNQVETKYILFGIDDVVYFDSVDFEIIAQTFREHSKDILGFTLRFGPDVECLKNGGDIITDVTVADQKVYRLNWKNGRTAHSRYPFELCSTVYPTVLVREVIDSVMNNNPVIKRVFSPNSVLMKALGKIQTPRSVLKSFGYFFSPNTLESWSCRWCQNHSERLPGSLYFQRQCASAIQVNMVNTSTKNESDGVAEFTVEALAEKYKQGFRLDIDFVSKNKPGATHLGSECFTLVQAETISNL